MSQNWNEFKIDRELLVRYKKMLIYDTLGQEISYLEAKYDKRYKRSVF